MSRPYHSKAKEQRSLNFEQALAPESSERTKSPQNTSSIEELKERHQLGALDTKVFESRPEQLPIIASSLQRETGGNFHIGTGTNSGKTYMALGGVVAQALSRGENVLWITPQRALVEQACSDASLLLHSPEECLNMVTGATSPKDRKARLSCSLPHLLIATPQVLQQEETKGNFAPENYAHIVFDEADVAVAEEAWGRLVGNRKLEAKEASNAMAYFARRATELRIPVTALTATRMKKEEQSAFQSLFGITETSKGTLHNKGPRLRNRKVELSPNVRDARTLLRRGVRRLSSALENDLLDAMSHADRLISGTLANHFSLAESQSLKNHLSRIRFILEQAYGVSFQGNLPLHERKAPTRTPKAPSYEQLKRLGHELRESADVLTSVATRSSEEVASELQELAGSLRGSMSLALTIRELHTLGQKLVRYGPYVFLTAVTAGRMHANVKNGYVLQGANIVPSPLPQRKPRLYEKRLFHCREVKEAFTLLANETAFALVGSSPSWVEALREVARREKKNSPARALLNKLEQTDEKQQSKEQKRIHREVVRLVLAYCRDDFLHKAKQDYPLLDDIRDTLSAEKNARIIISCRFRNDAHFLSQLINHHEGSCGAHAVPFTGTSGKSKAEQTRTQQSLEHFKSGDANVLVATSAADRGLHIPQATHLILVSPQGKLRQIVGRVGRGSKAGEVVIHWKTKFELQILRKGLAELRRK